jgi:hypothetical protein
MSAVYALLAGAKARAKRKGLEFDLKLDDIIIPANCPALGIPLQVAKKVSSANSPSLDRLDNTKGYTKDNVEIISLKANTMKGAGTLEDLQKLVAWLASRS